MFKNIFKTHRNEAARQKALNDKPSKINSLPICHDISFAY